MPYSNDTLIDVQHGMRYPDATVTFGSDMVNIP